MSIRKKVKEPKIVIGGPDCLGRHLNGKLAMNLTNVSRVTTCEIVTPKVYAEHLGRAKNPLFIIGPGLMIDHAKGKLPIDWAVDVAKAGDMAVCATADTAGPLIERGLKPDLSCGILEITGLYLVDAEWRGVNGKGQHDWVLFNGIPCFFAERALTTLLRYAPWLKTYTICPRTHHNADYTWPKQNKPGYTRYKHDLIDEFQKIKEKKEAGELETFSV